MNDEFQRLYKELMEGKIDTSQFLSQLKSVGDYSDDLLGVMQQQLKMQNWSALSKLIWAIQWVPDRKFTPLLCSLLDNHRYDGFMEAVADMLFDIGDERAVPSIILALDYYVEGDGSYSFNNKLIAALDKIGTAAAIGGITLALQSPHEEIRETAQQFLEGTAGT